MSATTNHKAGSAQAGQPFVAPSSPKPGAPRPGSPAAEQAAQAAKAEAEKAAQEAARPKPGPHPGQLATQRPQQEEANTEGGSSELTERDEAIAAYPFVAVTVQTTGIHPSTGRMVSIDALTFNARGEVGQDFHAVIDPEIDPGPFHQHGLTPEEIAEGQQFSRLLKPLDRLIDGRTLIVHETSFTWGFIVSEARRAMTAAARANRARNRNRGRGKRRRQKVGHVPTPVAIVDTLGSARRQSVHLTDIRLAAVARASGLITPSPKATVERAQVPESQTSRAATELLIELHLAQAAAGPLASAHPDDLRADRFGLQRSHVRVDAAEAPRMHHNPGTYKPGKELRRGMEVCVAPDIAMDPDVIIAALVKEELNYTEKLTRETSIVVCNVTTDLVGKPMHAQRKDIPLMADEAFLAALERVEDAGPAPEPKKSKGGAVPNSNNRRGSTQRRKKRKDSQSGSEKQNGSGKSRSGRRRRGGRGRKRRNS